VSLRGVNAVYTKLGTYLNCRLGLNKDIALKIDSNLSSLTIQPLLSLCQ